MFIRVIALITLICLLSAPVMAQSKNSSSTVPLKASDDAFLSEAPTTPLPKPSEDALSEVVGGIVAPEKEKPKKKQVYKAIPQVSLTRTIKDDRIDDGFVQGLIQQNAQ